jgi:hypothetical protein
MLDITQYLTIVPSLAMIPVNVVYHCFIKTPAVRRRSQNIPDLIISCYMDSDPCDRSGRIRGKQTCQSTFDHSLTSVVFK